MNHNDQQPQLLMSREWLTAFQITQEQTAQAHAAYQQAMATAHVAYLQAAQSGFASLAAIAGNGQAPALQAPIAAYQAPPVVAPSIPAITPVPVPPPVATAPPAPVVQPVAAPAPAAVAPAVSQQPPPPVASSTVDLSAVLLEVVAEKTGYAADFLTMDMNLEGDLGIDSIKRVEILSAMQEKAPSLPEVDAAAMASLQTLGQIVDHLQDADSTSAAPQPNNGAGPDIHALLLEVVAEKTGYAADFLTMDMNLEGDLGIDSIKRVEILSAMQEKAPSLPEVDAAAMASLQTLGEIVAYMNEA